MLPALSVLFGLQMLRMVMPQMVWILGDRFGLNAIVLGIIAIVAFSSAFLAGTIKKFFSSYRVIVCTATVLGLTRLLTQIPWSNPLINMIIAMTGIIMFGLFLSAYTDEMRFRGNKTTGNLIIGFLTGLVLDTAIHGAFGTYDIAWQSTILPFSLVIILVLLQWRFIFTFKPIQHKSTESGGFTWPWLAVGPFLFFEMVVLQNIARYTVSTGWNAPYVFGWILLSQIAGLFAAVLVVNKLRTNRLLISVGCGIVLIAGSVFPYPDQPWIAALSVFIQQVSASLLITLIIAGTINKKNSSGKSSVSIPNGAAFLLFGVLSLAYYTVYQINLPYENTVLEMVAAVIISICAIVPNLKSTNSIPSFSISWTTPVVALVLLILPITGIMTRQEAQTATGDGYPIKLMTYNLHNGFNPGGDLDMEALAKVIEDADPDIIALQEISRGWLISGRVDMLDWLSQRLDMPYVTGPTEGKLWGNAVLSKYPVTESINYELPPQNLFLRRGLLLVNIDIGNGESLNIIATHLHHIPADSEIRQQQVPALLALWDTAKFTVITGDMNAKPDSPEMALLREAGLVDVMDGSIPPEGYTFNSVEPFERIDYIWITPDLKSFNAEVIPVQASDHFPVVVELSR